MDESGPSLSKNSAADQLGRQVSQQEFCAARSMSDRSATAGTDTRRRDDSLVGCRRERDPAASVGGSAPVGRKSDAFGGLKT